LIVGGAFFGVAQHFVGFGDFLETFLGARFLADIGVIFARQPTIGFLDVLFRGIAGLRREFGNSPYISCCLPAIQDTAGGNVPPVVMRGFSLRP
jgi:hypothetical protein